MSETGDMLRAATTQALRDLLTDEARAAFADGAFPQKMWSALEELGLPYALSPFKYQVKCLEQLRAKFTALSEQDRAALRPVLERTGCWAHLSATPQG